MLGIKSILLAVIAHMVPFLPTQADQWGSVVLAHCYSLDDRRYQEHFFVRVFWTELGGGQLYSEIPNFEAPKRLPDLNNKPATCLINGKEVIFETLEYRIPTGHGGCGLCEKTGFRITVDGEVIWETSPPENMGDPVFKGTIDMDRGMLRVCTESLPETLGVDIPFEQDFLTTKTRIQICQTISY